MTYVRLQDGTRHRAATQSHAAAYRPDIDGLRALSVLTVIIFHAGLPILPGGFTAVDVFFVISGYLITQIMIRDHEKGRFSVVQFYNRRIRRILPALFTVLLSTMIAGLFFLLPSELARLGESVAAAALFGSNILFWHETNYFAGEAIGQPLLHTWTLAVEEQFYIVWPLMVAGLYRFGWQRHLRWLIVVVLLVSLAGAEGMARYSERTAFYMFPLRAWELLCGAALAVWRPPALRSRLLRELLGLTGILLVVVPMLVFEETMTFPGISAAPTCVGTAILIYVGAGEGSAVSRVLSARPLVLVGLISYSLYLVHWPIIAFIALNTGEMLTVPHALVAIVASLVLATLCWRFVEVPFRTPAAAPIVNAVRKPVGGITTRGVILSAAAGTALFAALGLVLAHARGLPARLPAAAVTADSFHQPIPYAKVDCFVGDDVPADLAACVFRNDPARQAGTLLWGDSHALHFVNAFRAMFAARREPLLISSASGCTPLPGATSVFGHGRSDDRCRIFNDGMLRLIDDNPQLRRVIVSAHWGAFHAEDELQPGSSPNMRYLLDGRDATRSGANSVRVFRDAMDRLAANLAARGVQLVLIGQTPVYFQNVPSCIARAIWRGQSSDRCSITIAQADAERRDTEPVLAGLARRYPDVTYYDPMPALCGPKLCRGAWGSQVVTWDSHHVTDFGAAAALAGLKLPAIVPLPDSPSIPR